jgi:serralysin
MSGSMWDSAMLAYSFMEAADYGDAPPDDMRSHRPEERLAIELMLGQVSGFTNLKFTLAPTSGGGDMRFTAGGTDYAGQAAYPGPGTGGDVWISRHHMDTGLLAPGESLNVTILHEIGHALGLKHGHEFPAMTPEHNTHEFSIMTYRSWSGAPESPFFNGSEENGGYPQSFMMYDVAALQHMYGANFSHNAGNTIYRWDPATGQMFVNGVGQTAPQINRIFMTLWDGGGIDTYDLSDYGGGVTIDLRPGEWTKTTLDQTVDLYEQGWDVPPTYARGNIANALLYKGDTRSLVENAIGGAGEDSLIGNQAANRLAGGAGNDKLSGGDGDDRLDGGAGDDGLNGGYGADLADYSGAGGAIVVDLALSSQSTGGAGVDSFVSIEGVLGSGFDDLLTGGGGANMLIGGGGRDTLNGRDGDDVLEGGLGDDTLDGGNGADAASYKSSAVGVSVSLGQTRQVINGSGTDDLVSIESLIGSAHADTLTGNGAANLLDGGGGADTLEGGGGDDIYVVDNAGDKAVEASLNGGMDAIHASVSFSLAGRYIEDLVLTGKAAVNGTGNGLANRLTGNAAANVLDGGAGTDALNGGDGDDVLSGGAGADTLVGGVGNDLYGIDDAADRVIENGFAAGIDTVHSSVSFSLAGQYLEALTLTGAAAIDGTGNGLANTITGNAATNVLSGAAGSDLLKGGAGNDRLDGGDGDDILDGGSGDDAVHGGNGRDTVSYASATAGVTINMASRTVGGSSGSDSFSSIESLIGFADSLTGDGIGNRLDGGAGADTLNGGGGDDDYVVDNSGDKVIESSTTGGIDTVHASVGFSLAGQYVERLVLTGNAAVDGTGNSLANTLTGNGAANRLSGADGNDTLDGGAGADTLSGGAGNDVYFVDNAGDLIVEASGQGSDTAWARVDYALADGAHVETLRAGPTSSGLALTGNGLANTIVGSAHADRLSGGGGNDILVGGAGPDSIAGGAGADTFRFLGGDLTVGFSSDRIEDFISGTDKIDLSGIDANGAAGGDQTFRFIGDAAFSGAAGELRYQVIEAGIFFSDGTLLEADTNGDGQADLHLFLYQGGIPATADFML